MHKLEKFFLLSIKLNLQISCSLLTYHADNYNTITALFYSISKLVIEYFCKIKFTIKYLYCVHANPCNDTVRII